MARVRFSLLALLLLAGPLVAATPGASAPAADTPEAASKAPATQPTTQPVPLNQFCLVNTDHAVDPAVTLQYEGKTIGFCCADCIDDFKKDPAKYIAKLGK